MSDIKRNPYTGMDMATSNNGNGEVVKVEDLINKPQKDWEQYNPVDTLEKSDSELYSLYDNLSSVNRGLNESIKIDEFINSDKSQSDNESVDDLSFKNDDLISNLTKTLY